jgi:hypothetical protein
MNAEVGGGTKRRIATMSQVSATQARARRQVQRHRKRGTLRARFGFPELMAAQDGRHGAIVQ